MSTSLSNPASLTGSTPPASLPPSSLSLTTMELLQQEVEDSWGSYLTGITEGLSGVLEGNATHAAAGLERMGGAMLDFADDLSHRVSQLADGVGNAAERNELESIMRGLQQQADSIRAAGQAEFARAAAAAAAGEFKGNLAGAVGSLADLYNVSKALADALIDGTDDSWSKVGENSTGILLGGGLRTLAAAGAAALGAPIVLGALGAGGAAYLGDKLGAPVFQYLNQNLLTPVVAGLMEKLAAVWYLETYSIELMSSPLILDLDSDGIETIAPNGFSGILFDLDRDGIRTATGG